MTLSVGQTVPDIALMHMTSDGPAPISRAELFGSKRVVLFAVPGAFTPTCTAQHLPSFLNNAQAIRDKGVDTIACVSVNDVFVMNAWGQAKDPDSEVLMLADGLGQWTQSAGLDWDLSGFGLGLRAQRFALIADDAVVSHLAVEQGADFNVSSGDSILEFL